MKQKTRDILVGLQIACIAIIITIGIALLASGCQAEPGDPPNVPATEQVTPGPPVVVWELTGLYAVGPLEYIWQKGIFCLSTGEGTHTHQTVEGLDTDAPSVVNRPDMECGFHADERWVLTCEEFDITGLFFHWTYWTIDLDSRRPHHGSFYWEVDALPDFYCVRNFSIDDVTPFYSRR